MKDAEVQRQHGEDEGDESDPEPDSDFHQDGMNVMPHGHAGALWKKAGCAPPGNERGMVRGGCARQRAWGESGMTTDPGAIAIVNARIWTGDPRRPWADGMLADGARLALVGSSAEVRKAAKPGTRVIDAAGKFVVPGFNDAHVHFVEGGFRLASVQLRDARTPEEFAATAPPELMDRALDAAMRYVAAQGVTSVHNMGSWTDLATFERAHAAGRLRTRIYAAVPLSSWARLRDHVAARGRGDEWLRIGGLKAFA
ncbi:MAG TPA: amidohydrolase family protein, partial [Gemmatimonadaceae bacterium]|nr:amidohydrolase family protein [Gemmatimonadaceae bacterium]